MRILLLIVAIALCANPMPTQADVPSSKRLTVLAHSMSPETLAALRAETRVKGLVLEEVSTSHLAPEIITAIAERSEVVAVLFRSSGATGDSLWAITSKDQKAHAPIPVGAESRAIAAIASSLVDDLVSSVQVDVKVDVQVHINSAPTVSAPPSSSEIITPPPTIWTLDVSGLVVSPEIWAAQVGILRTIQPSLRVGVQGVIAQIPNDGFAAALSGELSKVWGDKIRFELGGRGFYTRVWDDWNQCEDRLAGLFHKPCGNVNSGLGVGAFGSIGHTIGDATFYLRVGADLVTFPDEELVLAPNGGIGVELPL